MVGLWFEGWLEMVWDWFVWWLGCWSVGCWVDVDV
jgi:hypothetical protein